MEVGNTEKEKETNERHDEIKVKLERTENMFQSKQIQELEVTHLDKEKKWVELERIVVNYARKDKHLRDKLSEIKYI